MHAHRQRGGRGVAGETALAGGELGEVEAPPAELGGHGGGEIADRAQLVEVVVEVGVGPVERAGSGPEPLEHLRRELACRTSFVDVMVMVIVVSMTPTVRRSALTALPLDHTAMGARVTS